MKIMTSTKNNFKKYIWFGNTLKYFDKLKTKKLDAEVWILHLSVGIRKEVYASSNS